MTLAWLAAGAAAGALADAHTQLDDGRLDQAIASLEAVESPSGVVAFDLGTLYLRKAEPAPAIAHLRAAARLRPRDGSVHHNLALARAELGLVPAAVPPRWAWMSVLTPGELGLLGLLATALGSALVLRRPWRVAGVTVGTVGLATGTVAWLGYADLRDHPVAVVSVEEAVVRDAAAIDAGRRFDLPLGAEVRVQRSYQGFLLVEDGRGRRGWLASSHGHVAW